MPEASVAVLHRSAVCEVAYANVDQVFGLKDHITRISLIVPVLLKYKKALNLMRSSKTLRGLCLLSALCGWSADLVGLFDLGCAAL